MGIFVQTELYMQRAYRRKSDGIGPKSQRGRKVQILRFPQLYYGEQAGFLSKTSLAPCQTMFSLQQEAEFIFYLKETEGLLFGLSATDTCRQMPRGKNIVTVFKLVSFVLSFASLL